MLAIECFDSLGIDRAYDAFTLMGDEVVGLNLAWIIGSDSSAKRKLRSRPQLCTEEIQQPYANLFNLVSLNGTKQVLSS